ncbi:MAG TPA: helix-turn-helix domain-containing protein [Candidatus Nanoarchaeia archaeon]|nr:helix-turn-helix domain-containing protein [Candidatus Nanoarchaeia archaeon]
MDINELKKIGFTQGETQIYAALLELGETTRTELAKKSGISPSKIYDVVNRLMEKGIVSTVKKQGVLHFSAADPARLTDFLDQKEAELNQERTLVDQLLPILLAKHQKTKEEVDIEVFYGWEGMQTAYNDIVKSLSKGDINYIFGASKGQDPKQADLFFSKYYERTRKKKYKIKIIFNENMRGYTDRVGFFLKTAPHEARFLHQNTFTELNFYKDTVLFIMLLKKPIVIRVHSQEAADSFKKFFETMWKQAKP